MSRKFVCQQAAKARHALDDAFLSAATADTVLFQVEVTKRWLRQVMRVALRNQRDDLLAFAGVLDKKLTGIAQALERLFCALEADQPPRVRRAGFAAVRGPAGRASADGFRRLSVPAGSCPVRGPAGRANEDGFYPDRDPTLNLRLLPRGHLLPKNGQK